MARIVLDRLGLCFKVRANPRITFKDWILRNTFLKKTNPAKEFPALKDVSLSVSDGERLAILGHNGAGKSTLLKTIAGIYPPTSGTRVVEGRISSLFDIALGFEADASGWENIMFRGYLQGETPKTLRKDKIEEIAEFSELKEFMNMPVRYYSAGMALRLAFSIATAIEPEVLLVDEVLAVGDLSFQQKARKRMEAMMATAKLMVMVSHDLGALKSLCTKAVWMDHGSVYMTGPVGEVVDAYKAHYQPEGLAKSA